MELIMLVVFLFAAKKGWDAAWEAWQQAKQAYMRRAKRNHPKMTRGSRIWHQVKHDLGYGAAQARHGFPVFRHGFAEGWHEGMKRHHQARAAREQARTRHLEARQEAEQEIAAQRKRQQELTRPPDPDPPADPEPEPAPDPPQEAEPEPPGEGDQTMSETTYQSVTNQMDTAETEAEGHAAEAEQAATFTEEHAEQARQAKDRGVSTSEDMQSLGVDAETLSAMADHLQALDDADKHAAELNDQMTLLKEAWQRVQETAGNVKGQMVASGHGALDEAHANAAGGGAEKPFYDQG